MRGTISNWNETRGFGFIAPDEGGADVFVHAKDLPEGVLSLAPGQTVEFETAPSPDGRPRGRVIEVESLAVRAPALSRPPAPAAARPAGQGRERIWPAERRTELADKAADILLELGSGDIKADGGYGATRVGATRVDAMRLLLQAISDDARND